MAKQRENDDGLRELRVTEAVHARVKALANARGHLIPTTATELLTAALDAVGAPAAPDSEGGG